MKQSEAQFQKSIVDLARTLGFRVAHFHRAQVGKSGWATPVAADGKGFPDLVLCGHGRLIFIECKSDTGQLREEQKRWLAALGTCGFVECYVCRPSSWGEISEILAGRMVA